VLAKHKINKVKAIALIEPVSFGVPKAFGRTKIKTKAGIASKKIKWTYKQYHYQAEKNKFPIRK